MKKIFTLFAALAMVMSMSAATKTIYCKMAQSWWKADGAAVGAYAWKDGGATNASWPGVRMTKVDGETDLWSIDIDTDKYNKIIFTRVNASGTIADWGAKTADQNIPTDDKNLFTITSTSAVWGDPGCTGTWSTFVADAPKTYKDITITVTANAAASIKWSDAGDKLANATDYVAMTAGENNTYTYTLAQVDEASGVNFTIKVGDIESASKNTNTNITADFKDLMKSVVLKGIDSDWSDKNKMTVADDYLTASITLPLVAKDYEWKITFNGEWFGGSKYVITRDKNSLAVTDNGDGNGKLSADVEGDYVFTYTYATKTLTVTYPELASVYDVTVTNATVSTMGQNIVLSGNWEEKLLTVSLWQGGATQGFGTYAAEDYAPIFLGTAELTPTSEGVYADNGDNTFTFTATANDAEGGIYNISVTGAIPADEPEIEWMEMPLEISNLTTMEMPVEGVTYLQLTGRDDKEDADVMLFLNNYTGEEKAYEVNAESSYMTFGGSELTVIDGSITKSVDPELGDVYAGIVHASVGEEGETMYVAFDLKMYALPPIAIELEDVEIVVNEESAIAFFHATWEGSPLQVEVSGFEEVEFKEYPECWLSIGDDVNWVDAAAGPAAVIIEDGVAMLEGEFTSFATGKTYEVMLTGTLPVVEPEVPTALDNVDTTVAPAKAIVNGQLVIVKDGVKYNAQGAVVK